MSEGVYIKNKPQRFQELAGSCSLPPFPPVPTCCAGAVDRAGGVCGGREKGGRRREGLSVHKTLKALTSP